MQYAKSTAAEQGGSAGQIEVGSRLPGWILALPRLARFIAGRLIFSVLSRLNRRLPQSATICITLRALLILLRLTDARSALRALGTIELPMLRRCIPLSSFGLRTSRLR
jgi:hypothetical protein